MTRSGDVWKLWFASTAGAGVLVVLLLSLFRIPVSKPNWNVPHGDSKATKLELAPLGNELLFEEVALRDPTPLFLPTPWNASEDALAMNAPREPGGSFQDYAPHFTLPATELNLAFPATFGTPAGIAEAFEIDEISRSLPGLGQVDRKIVALPARDGYIEIVGAADGEVLISQTLGEVRPPERGNWQPLEILVAVDAAGVVGAPVITESSRASDVDSFFKDYVVKVLQIGSRLSPGFYRINIGP